MIRLRHKVLIHSFRLFDQLMLVAAAALIIYFRPQLALLGGHAASPANYRITDTIGVLILALGWVGIFAYTIRYKADRFVALTTQIKDLVKATTLAAFWLMLVSGIFSVGSFNTLNILVFWGAVTGTGVVSRLFMRIFLMSARRSGYNYRYLLIIGANSRGNDVAAKIDAKPELGYKIVGFVAENESARQIWAEQGVHHGEVLGMLEDLQCVLKRERVDEMMVCLPVESRFSDIVNVVQHARELGVVVRLMPDLQDGSLFKNVHLEEFDGEHVITMFREQMLLQLLAKRMVDATLSATALVVLAPLMIIVAILIKVTSPGPVFFAQDRVGMNQRRFRIYKFRSMVVDAEAKKKELAHLNEIADGPAFKMKNDPRITAIGRFIRKTSIDELPQLFNVLHGEMSLVGPRPPLPDEVKMYEWLFRKRLSVKPGITCVWQISGRSNTTFERWMQMDSEYIDNWSIWLDLKILVKTVPAVLLGRGAS
ncbi:sugar transferase [Luteolibacter flavescens]|uniref:Sugar transferase n=1 Tax=Luteolibacter flavescens TaxID=1859460 RepID=A0ABT3FS39_9BACT|nr:sugar transferase [Luteolibacter flavescens]MCW1886367.1 sugar transferase [Luteolibacter flavescens]